MDIDEYLEIFVKGAIVGHLIGDAIGMPYVLSEKTPNANTIDLIMTNEFAPGSYTSNSGLMLCTITSINESEGLDLSDLMDNFQEHHIGGYLAADEDCSFISPVVSQALKNYSNGMPTDKTGMHDADSNDAGALTRMLPIALYYASESTDDLIKAAQDACSITHAHPSNKLCCALYCLMIRNILLQADEKASALLADYQTEEPHDGLSDILNWHHDNQPSGSDYVIDAFWSSLEASKQNSFIRCVSHAVAMGNAMNTTGCLTGSFAGVEYGLNEIPQTWLNNLRLTDEVMEIVTIFTNTVTKRLKSNSQIKDLANSV